MPRRAGSATSVEGSIWDADTNLAAGGAYRDTSSTVEDTSPSLSFGTSLGTTLYGLFPAERGSVPGRPAHRPVQLLLERAARDSGTGRTSAPASAWVSTTAST